MPDLHCVMLLDDESEDGDRARAPSSPGRTAVTSPARARRARAAHSRQAASPSGRAPARRGRTTTTATAATSNPGALCVQPARECAPGRRLPAAPRARALIGNGVAQVRCAQQALLPSEARTRPRSSFQWRPAARKRSAPRGQLTSNARVGGFISLGLPHAPSTQPCATPRSPGQPGAAHPTILTGHLPSAPHSGIHRLGNPAVSWLAVRRPPQRWRWSRAPVRRR